MKKKLVIISAILLLLISLSLVFYLNASAAGNTQTVTHKVVADKPVTANPGVYYYQLDNGSFRADTSSGRKESPNAGNNQDAYPAKTQIRDDINLTNYDMPYNFEVIGNPSQTYNRNELSRIYTTNSDIKWVTREPKSYEGVSKGIKSDGITVDLVTYTGAGFTFTDRERFDWRKGTSFPKYNVFYATPLEVLWRGEVEETKEIRVIEDSVLKKGQNKQYRAEVRTKLSGGSWGSWVDVTSRPETKWSTSNSSTATVSSTGFVSAKDYGQADIKATWKSGQFNIEASAIATVGDGDMLIIQNPPPNACLGETIKLTANLMKRDGSSHQLTAHPSLTWASSNTSIATITSAGVITPKAKGQTTITAHFKDTVQKIDVKSSFDLSVYDCKTDPPPKPEPPEPEVDPNLPPIVNIIGPTVVKAGQEFNLFASAYDPDGEIVEYQWNFQNADGGEPNEAILSKLYYMKEGMKYVTVAVQDNDGAWAGDDHEIEVIPPKPEAALRISDVRKENRKLTITSTSSTPTHFEFTESYYTIEPLEGQNVNKIHSLAKNTKVENNKFKVTLNVRDIKPDDFLIKEPGQYKIYHYVKNTAGLSDETEVIITIQPDLPPTADFSTVTTLFREDIEKEPSETLITIYDRSGSSDDIIAKRIWTYRYDSNNDGNFDDEELEVIDNVNKTEVSFPTSKVGKYKVELLAIEEFAQETIEEFVTAEDRRRNDTTNKAIAEKIIEVKNLAPIAGFDVGKKKKVDLNIILGDTVYKDTNLIESKINEHLTPLLKSEKIDLELTFDSGHIMDDSKVYYPIERLLSFSGTLHAQASIGYFTLDTNNYKYFSDGNNYNGSTAIFDEKNNLIFDSNCGAFNCYTTGDITSKLEPYNGQRVKVWLSGSTAVDAHLSFSRQPKSKKANISLKETNNISVNAILEDKNLSNDGVNLLKLEMNDKNTILIALGNSENKIQFNSFISKETGRFFENTPLDIAISQMANYILEEVNKRKTIDLQVAIGDTSYSKEQIESKLNQILKPTLTKEKIGINLSFSNVSIKDTRNPNLVWEVVPFFNIVDPVFDFENYDYQYYLSAGGARVIFYNSSRHDPYRKVIEEIKWQDGLQIMPIPEGTKNIQTSYSGKAYEAIARKPKHIDSSYDANQIWEIDPRYSANSNQSFNFNDFDYNFYFNASGARVDFRDINNKSLSLTTWSEPQARILNIPIGTTWMGVGNSGKSYEAIARKPKNIPASSFSLKESNNQIFALVIEDNPIGEVGKSLIQKEVTDKEANLVAFGTDKNKPQFNEVITNVGQGAYLENTDLDFSVENLANYILEQVNHSLPKVDLVFGLGNAYHSQKNAIETKINNIVKNKLNTEGIKVQSLSIQNSRFSNSKENYIWEYLNHGPLAAPGNYNWGYDWGQNGYTYRIIGETYPGYDITLYARRRDGGEDSFKSSSITLDDKIYTGEFYHRNEWGGNAGWNQIVYIRKPNNDGDPNNPFNVWQYLNHGPLAAPGNYNWGYDWGQNGYTYRIIGEINSSYDITLYAKRRDGGEDSFKSSSMTLDDKTYTGEFYHRNEWGGNAGWNQIAYIRKNTTNSDTFNIPPSKNQQFIGIIDDKTLLENTKNNLIKTSLLNNAYLSGLGTINNKSDFESLITKNMEKGTFIDNTNLDTALDKYTDYIIETVKKHSKMKEIYLTLEEEAEYFTYYEDAEKDPKFADRWRYDQKPSIFENNMGFASFNLKNLDKPKTKFDKVGRYQTFYAARDNPIWWNDDKFDNYRLWSKEADNWYIYIHRKPIADFSFTINQTTGNYSITNKAYDLDKQSINIGFGGGIKKMSYKWREKGQFEWKDGLPTNPLQRKVYEVRQDVEDFQGAKAYVIKLMDATGVNKPPIADFIPIPDEIIVGESTKLHNKSYDPNGDPLKYEWFISTDDKKTWTQFSTEEHPTRQLNQVGEVWFKVKATETNMTPALSAESEPKKVTVKNNNQPPVACMQIPSPNYIGDTIVIKSCASDPDNDPLLYIYTITKASGQQLIFSTGDSQINSDGDLTLIADQHPTDIGTWTITQEVSDGTEKVSVTGSLVVLDQIVEGQVNHTAKWLENLQKFNAKFPSKAFNLVPANGLVEFVPGEKFVLVANETQEAVTIDVFIKEYRINFGTVELMENGISNIWNGELWDKKMIDTFKNGEELTFVFTAEFANGWIDTDEVKVRIKDDPYWRQHTTY